MKDNLKLWTKYFTNIEPYYAIKCNNDNNVLEELVENNWNFDCASINEIEIVKNCSKKYGKDNKIIFSNPVKWENDIKCAKKIGINLYTLDNVQELSKLSKLHYKANYLLRVAVDDKYSKCKLNSKFGIKSENINSFFRESNNYSANFSGYAFHVGSGCMSSISYKNALDTITDLIKEYPYNNNSIINIGGGFIKDLDMLNDISNFLKEKMLLFPKIKWIAEPGRLIVNDAYDLYTKVINVDERRIFINNSIYGDLNCVMFDHATPSFQVIRDNEIIYEFHNHTSNHTSTSNTSNTSNTHNHDYTSNHTYNYNENKYVTYNIYGSTCDSLDKIYSNIRLPEIKFNDTIKFINMGAYTISSRTNFNGVPVADIISDQR